MGILKALIHICCAPDATVVFERLRSEYNMMGYFYNPNIHTETEYELRAKETVTAETMAWKIYDLRNIYLDKLQPGQNTVKLSIEGSGKCHCVCELHKWYFDRSEFWHMEEYLSLQSGE